MMRVIILIFILFTSCTCQLQNYDRNFPCVTSYPAPEFCPDNHPKKLALVLGAGGARGMAHVGVLHEFEEAGIPVNLIVGCSTGSLVGSLYAKRPCAGIIHQKLARLKRPDLLNLNMFIRCNALCYGNELKHFLLRHLNRIHFNELHIPLVVVATDLCNGELVILNKGAVAPAVHASCAYPLVFSPVKIYNKILVDGGVINPIPVDVALEYNVEVVVAVDIGTALQKTFPAHLFGVAKRCTEILFYNRSLTCVKNADVIIRPNLGNAGTFDDCYNQIVYEAGRKAAREAIPQIKKLLNQEPCINH